MVPLLFLNHMAEILDEIRSLLQPLLEQTDMFIVNMKVKPINNIKIYLDSDTGFSVDKSAKVNRNLYALIEEKQLFPDGDFSLEVSSPGVDEPLHEWRQYKKNIGRKVLVTLADGAEKLGTLKEINEERLVLEMSVPKKKETTIVEIPFSDIKTTVVQISF